MRSQFDGLVTINKTCLAFAGDDKWIWDTYLEKTYSQSPNKNGAYENVCGCLRNKQTKTMPSKLPLSRNQLTAAVLLLLERF